MKRIFFTLLLMLASLGAMASSVSVTDFGAVADRTTDNTAAFQAAIDSCFDSKGGVVSVPTGYYCIKGRLTVRDGVILKGTYEAPPTNGPGNRTHQDQDMKGTVLMAYAGKNDPEGEPFIRLQGDNAGVQGLIIYYPEWLQETVPPIPYSPCIFGTGGNNQSVVNCNLLNPYVGIRFHASHRMHISGVQGYPIKTGISIDECYDICRIENVHFWPYNVIYRADDPYCKWINQNGTAFEFARTDWQYCTNTFCFGYNAGYRFVDLGHGGCNGSFMCIGADSCVNAVSVEKIQRMGLAITNGEFVGRWSSTDSCTVDIKEGADGKVGLVNCTFWGPIDTCIRSRSERGVLSVSECNFVSWNVNHDNAPAISITGGKAVIEGNTFGSEVLHVETGPKVKSAVITGNLSDSAFTVNNSAPKNRVKIEGNMPEKLVPTAEDLVNYSIDFMGDAETEYIKGFEGAEKRFGGMRWSSENATISLPVLPDTEYTVYAYVHVPKYAVSETSGIYNGDTLVIRMDKELVKTLSGKVKTGRNQKVLDLDIRVKGWVPKEQEENSNDPRVLGVGVMQIKLESKKGAKTFNFNTEQYR
ncbi:MAG: hypothetical protein IJT95_06610 [Abditibacteriota bacterium]|nr:hypothetical protein [Abditibacteriota bacterium]